MNKYFTFVDGVEMNRNHPDTFHIPDADEKAAIKVGDFVKIGFIPTDDAKKEGIDITERMWVKVSELDAPRGDSEPLFLTGTLANDPFVFSDVLSFEDVVSFENRHILSIMPGDE